MTTEDPLSGLEPVEPLVEGLGYLVLGVEDLDASVAYYEQICRLVVVERRDDVVFLTGDEQHHWLRLERQPAPGLIRLGFRASDPRALARAVSRLEQVGIAVDRSPSPSADVLRGAVRFRDPAGLEIELYEDIVVAGRSPVPDSVGLDLLLHAVVNVVDPVAESRFYQEVLGFRRSDQIEDLVVFLRAGNRYHHSLAFAAGGATRLDHFAVHVRDLDHVMRFRTHALATGTLSDDVVRHAASGSVSIYLRDEGNDWGVELASGHDRIDDDHHRGRVLRAAPTTANMWAEPFPDTAELRRRPGSPAGSAEGSVAGTVGGTDAARLVASGGE